MANNYTSSSSFLPLDACFIECAGVIIDRVIAEIEDNPEELPCGAGVELMADGVEFIGDEYIDPEHVEQIAKALVEELKINDPFYCSWAYTCSRPRTDEFGGGAFVVRRGNDTQWVDAMQHVHSLPYIQPPAVSGG